MDVTKEIAARRAVEGVAEEIVKAGGSLAEGIAVAEATRFTLLGEPEKAKTALSGKVNGAEAEILAKIRSEIGI
jgi:hypothetical protein